MHKNQPADLLSVCYQLHNLHAFYVIETKFPSYIKKQPRKPRSPGLSLMNRYQKIPVRIKRVINIHLYVYQS